MQELFVGTTADYPPFSFFHPNTGELTGLDIDLVLKLGAQLGFRVRFSIIGWPELSANLAEGGGEFDMIWSGLTATKERARLGHLTCPYLANASVLVGLRGASGLAMKPDRSEVEAFLHGKRIGVNKGGYLESLARSFLKPEGSSRLRPLEDNTALAEQLVAGHYEVFFSDAIEAQRFAQDWPVEILCTLEQQQHVGFVARKHPGLAEQCRELLQVWQIGSVTDDSCQKRQQAAPGSKVDAWREWLKHYQLGPESYADLSASRSK